MNPHALHSTSARSMFSSIWLHRRLIVQMTRREVVGRYRGSVFGLAWSFFNPLLMLVVYTFVFGVVFKARWGTGPADEGRAKFALILFVGLIVHGLLAECMLRAPGLIVDQVNYVKKVVFPLEILAVVAMLSALFHAMVSGAALLLAIAVIERQFLGTAIFLPVIVAPLAIGSLGLIWIFASLGVFVRDVAQTMGLVTTILLFVSPVFFPVTALPEVMRQWVALNPLTFYIEQARNVLIWGVSPEWTTLAIHFLIAGIFAWVGYWWFQQTRKGFSDVL